MRVGAEDTGQRFSLNPNVENVEVVAAEECKVATLLEFIPKPFERDRGVLAATMPEQIDYFPERADGPVGEAGGDFVDTATDNIRESLQTKATRSP